MNQKKKIDLFELNKREQGLVKGGNSCGCGCNYADSGGSSTYQNGHANMGSGLSSGGICVMFASVDICG